MHFLQVNGSLRYGAIYFVDDGSAEPQERGSPIASRSGCHTSREPDNNPAQRIRR